MKRIIICMDGTWQSLNQPNLTNIGIIARSVAHKETRPDGSHVYQTVIYTHGVGSSVGALSERGFLEQVAYSFNRLAGGAFGEGLEDGIVDTYLRLAFEYEEGDEIYIFGFSRGAFAARRLSGFINTAGIVSRRFTHMARDGFRLYYGAPKDDAPQEKRDEHAAKVREFRLKYGKGGRNADGTRRATEDVPPITYLGVFDTVQQRGFAEVLSSITPWHEKSRFNFRNNRISRNVLAARHAVAVDEARIGFPVALWEDLDQDNQRMGRRAFEQRWFVGSHGDVGGGESGKLSAMALKWVAEGAAAQGLRFYATYGDDESPLDEALRKAGFDAPISRPRFFKSLQPIHYPFRSRRIWRAKDRPTLSDMEDLLDETVMRRVSEEKLRYNPSPLRPFRKVLREWQDGHKPR